VSAWLVALVALAVQPEQVVSRLFAVTTDGPYISYSWGEHWSRLRPHVRGIEGDVAAFVCLGPDVYAGGSDGVFISGDYGENYVRVESFPGKSVTTFHTARLFALEPTIFVGTASGLYRSTDGGSKWQRVGASAIAGAVRDTAWPGPQFYAATDEGLFVSEDVGESWERLEGGLPAAPILSVVVSRFFIADPKIIVGTRGAGLYRSDDGGASFEAVGGRAMLSKTVHALYWWNALLIVGTDDGLFLSDDAGDTLREAGELDGFSVLSLSVPVEEATLSDILVGTDRGVFKSSDGGARFRRMTEGIGEPGVSQLATFPPPPQGRERSR
jgi:photosystem II stability/assembly factor-like uncharacterized protein